MHLACMLEILPGWLSESLSLYSGQAVANLGWMLAIPIILLMLATPMYIVIWCYMVVSYGTCPPRICRGFSMTLWEASHRPRRWTHTSWSCSGVWLGWDGGRSRVPKGFSVSFCREVRKLHPETWQISIALQWMMDDFFSIFFWGGDSIGLRFCWIFSRAVFVMSLHRKHSGIYFCDKSELIW